MATTMRLFVVQSLCLIYTYTMLPMCHFNAVLVTLYHAVEIQKGCGGFGKVHYRIRYRIACVGIAVVA